MRGADGKGRSGLVIPRIAIERAAGKVLVSANRNIARYHGTPRRNSPTARALVQNYPLDQLAHFYIG